jgi:hypothetical protein
VRLTTEQLAELEYLQYRHGPGWKRTLQGLWDSGRDESMAVVRQLRNCFGPAWLKWYRRGDERVGYLRKTQQEQLGLKRPYWTTAYRIVDREGNDIVQPWLATKGEAIALAKSMNLTLVREEA